MYNTKHVQVRVIATLLMAVMLLIHVVKVFHTHAASGTGNVPKYEHACTQAHIADASCSICEFQLAKDTPFTGEMILAITPASVSPTYSRLLTSINPDRLSVISDRGPPTHKA